MYYKFMIWENVTKFGQNFIAPKFFWAGTAMQWWILGEANEAVASGPPFFGGPPLENSIYSFGFAQWTIWSEDLFFFFLENTLILEEKEGNQR